MIATQLPTEIREDAGTLFGFFSWSQAHPHRTAIVADDRRITYDELATTAQGLASGLEGLGLGRGDVLIYVAHNDVAYFELVLAAQLAGIYLVPMNAQSTAAEIAYVARDSSAAVVVLQDRIVDGLTTAELPRLRFSVGASRTGWPSYRSISRPAGGSMLDAVVTVGGVLPYTSGTTGRPKGVLRPLAVQHALTIGAALAELRSDTFDLRIGAGVHLVCSPLYHNAPGTYAQIALHLGHTVVLQSRFDAAEALTAVETHGVTWSHMVPTHFQRLLALPREDREHRHLTTLETVLHAGAPCPPRVKSEMVAWLGPIVWEYYGATEGLVSVLSPVDWQHRPGTVGRPVPGTRVLIRDEAGFPAGSGEVGQIWFSVPTPFSYLGDPVKTAANRYEGLVTVGDVGSLDDDGYLTLHDRRTDLIISGGVNVYPAEIEGILAGHPWITDTVVVGAPSERWGHEVVAVIEMSPLAPESDTAVAGIQEFVNQEIAAYKRPKRIVQITSLPRAENGKVSRATIRQWLADSSQVLSPGGSDGK